LPEVPGRARVPRGGARRGAHRGPAAGRLRRATYGARDSAHLAALGARRYPPGRMAMAQTEERPAPPTQADRDALAREWRRLGRAATAVAALTSPAAFVVLYVVNDLPLWLSIALTIFLVLAFRGAVDIICHRFIPRPSMYDATPEQAAEDVLFRRRRWFWRTTFRRLFILGVFLFLVALFVWF